MNPDAEYEIGVVDYPKVYYGILKNDYSSRIEVWVTHHDVSEENILTYTPQTNIEANDIYYMLNIINAELTTLLEDKLGEDFSRYFAHRGFFTYSEQFRRAQITVRKRFCREKHQFCKIALKFGSRISDAMSMIYPSTYTVYEPPFMLVEVRGYIPAPYQPRTDGGIDFVLIFTDCVALTSFGGQRMNLLKAMFMAKTGGVYFHHTVYKPLNKSILDEIAVTINDQRGRPVNCREGRSITLLLHMDLKILQLFTLCPSCGTFSFLRLRISSTPFFLERSIRGGGYEDVAVFHPPSRTRRGRRYIQHFGWVS